MRKAPAYSPFRDPDIPETTKQQWRVKGGQLGGRRRKYVKGTRVPIGDLAGVKEQLEEVVANLREMDQTPAVCNSLIRALQVYANIELERQDREQIEAEIAELKEMLGDE